MGNMDKKINFKTLFSKPQIINNLDTSELKENVTLTKDESYLQLSICNFDS